MYSAKLESSTNDGFIRPKGFRIKDVFPIKAPDCICSTHDKGTTVKEEFGTDVYFCQTKSTNVLVTEKVKVYKKA